MQAQWKKQSADTDHYCDAKEQRVSDLYSYADNYIYIYILSELQEQQISCILIHSFILSYSIHVNI